MKPGWSHGSQRLRYLQDRHRPLLLVVELTDVSRPSDGNRTLRKAIDRRHLARASDRAKTIKLADVIDNCTDIVRNDPRFGRVFVAEPLRSFDAGSEADEVGAVLDAPVAGVRIEGEVRGYLRRDELVGSGPISHRPIAAGQLLDASSPLSEIVLALTRHDPCFITLLGQVVGYVSRQEMQKPVVRMWLFGLITLIELESTEQVRKRWPDDAWTELLTKSRLAKARELQRERARRGTEIPLLDCLQLADKAGMLVREPEVLAALGFRTRGAAKTVIKDLQSLRNHLAHAQDIVSHDWTQIVRLARRLEAVGAGDGGDVPR